MTLRVVDGGNASPISGDEVMAKIAEVLAEHLHRVPLDDPFRTALDALALAAGAPNLKVVS